MLDRENARRVEFMGLVTCLYLRESSERRQAAARPKKRARCGTTMSMVIGSW